MLKFGRAAPARLRQRSVIIAAALLSGVAIRIAWNALRPSNGANAEVLNVAVALASGHGFADAFGRDSGPTAHLLPISPAIGGAVYSIFGIRSLLSEILLATWSIGLAMATYLILMRAFARLGTPPGPRVAAFVAGCLLPAYIAQEAVDFRLWDGGLTAMLMALLIERLAATEQHGNVPLPLAVTIGLTGALLLFVNAPAGVAAVACCAVLALRRLTWRQTIVTAAAGAGLLAATVVPWTIRNYAAFGTFIPSRSNAGLELAVGMDPGALAAPDRGARFERHFIGIHPNLPVARPAFDRAGGEIAYSRLLGRRTADWITAHPAQALRLAMLHVRQQFMPEPWQFALFGSHRIPPRFRAILVGALSVVGLLGIALALAQRRRGWIYLATLIATMSILTSPFQPVPRYTYLYYPFMIFAAADVIAAMWRTRRSRAPRSTITPSR